MKLQPVLSRKQLLYSVGLLCAGLTACDENSRHNVPGIVPNDNPPSEPEELPQALGGDVPYTPTPDDE